METCRSVKFVVCWFCVLSGTLPYTLQKLLDRFDYDDEPEAMEDTKKEDTAVTVAAPSAAAAPPAPSVATPAIAPALPVPSATSPPPPQVPLWVSFSFDIGNSYKA